MFRYLMQLVKPIPTGRWGNMHDKEKEIIKMILANSDHCGDFICGHPEEVKNIIQNQKLNKDLNKNDSIKDF